MDAGCFRLLIFLFYVFLICIIELPVSNERAKSSKFNSQQDLVQAIDDDSSKYTKKEFPCMERLNCAWDYKVPNEIAKQWKDTLEIDSTDRLQNLNDNVCEPQSFGYSVQKGNLKFPKLEKIPCNLLQIDNSPEIQVNLEDNTAIVRCKEKSPYILKQPKIEDQRLFILNNLQNKWDQEQVRNDKTYLKPDQEFILAKCGDQQYSSAFYQPRYNQTLHEEIRQSMKNREQKPLIVLNIVLDSLSRRHFYRMLPKTIDYLKQINKDWFSVFDFKLHNNQGANSVKNMIPMLSGQVEPKEFFNQNEDNLGQNALWSIFKDNGFLTYFGLDNCDFHFPYAVGKNPKVDYGSNMFFCAAAEFLGLRTLKHQNLGKQRCVGDKMCHSQIFDYIDNLVKMYNDVNIWGYTHITTAHESTGLQGQMMDDDLVNFLKGILQYKETHNFAIFLQADHGMRYGNWFNEIEGYQENKLPACFLIFSSEILDQIQYSFDTLLHNTMKLTTKIDLRATQLGLLKAFSNKVYFNNENAVDLIRNKVKGTRDCESANIFNSDCACLNYEEIQIDKDQWHAQMIKNIAQQAIDEINYKSYASFMTSKGQICQKVTLKEIKNLYYFVLSKRTIQWFITITINESDAVSFNVIARYGQVNWGFFMAQSDQYPVQYEIKNNLSGRLKLIGISRKDSFSGQCEKTSRQYGINPEFCICNEF